MEKLKINFFTKIKFFLSYFLLSAGPVLAAQNIDGFYDLTFGMSVADVSALYSLVEKPVSGDYDQVFKIDPKINIDGDEYEIEVGFRDNLLVLVQMSRLFWDTQGAYRKCEFEFNKILGLFKVRYGDPDQDASESTTRSSEIRNARFTSQNGNSISLNSLSVDRSCLIVVLYVAQSDGVVQF